MPFMLTSMTQRSRKLVLFHVSIECNTTFELPETVVDIGNFNYSHLFCNVAVCVQLTCKTNTIYSNYTIGNQIDECAIDYMLVSLTKL